jgi:hypothetical protein
MFELPLYRPDGSPYYALWFHLSILAILSVYCFYMHFKNRKKK